MKLLWQTLIRYLISGLISIGNPPLVRLSWNFLYALELTNYQNHELCVPRSEDSEHKPILLKSGDAQSKIVHDPISVFKLFCFYSIASFFAEAKVLTELFSGLLITLRSHLVASFLSGAGTRAWSPFHIRGFAIDIW